MRKFIGSLIQGLFLGLLGGLCLAGLAALAYRQWKGTGPSAHVGYFTTYFFAVGGLMGCVGGWGLALQIILARLMGSLIGSIARLVPLTAGRVGTEWVDKIERFLAEVLAPMPALLRRGAAFLAAARLGRPARVNRALEKALVRDPEKAGDPEWLAATALHYFLDPVWAVFYAAYAILLLFTCFFGACRSCVDPRLRKDNAHSRIL